MTDQNEISSREVQQDLGIICSHIRSSNPESQIHAAPMLVSLIGKFRETTAVGTKRGAEIYDLLIRARENLRIDCVQDALSFLDEARGQAKVGWPAPEKKEMMADSYTIKSKQGAQGSLQYLDDLLDHPPHQSFGRAGTLLKQFQEELIGIPDCKKLSTFLKLAEESLDHGAYTEARGYLSEAMQDVAARPFDWEARIPEALSVELVRKKLEEARDSGEYRGALLQSIRWLIKSAHSRERDIPGHFYYSVDELVKKALSAEDFREAEKLIDRSLGLCRLQKAAR
jgi:hypothetical protein